MPRTSNWVTCVKAASRTRTSTCVITWVISVTVLLYLRLQYRVICQDACVHQHQHPSRHVLFTAPSDEGAHGQAGDAQRQPAVLLVFESFFLILLVLATMKGNKCKSSDAPNASAAMLEVQELRSLSTGRSCHAVSPACMRARRSAGPLHVRQPACCQARLAADTLPHTCKRQHAGGASSAVAGLLRAHVCIPCRTGNTGRTRSI